MMHLSEEEKELLIKAFTVYYEKEVWGGMASVDNVSASEEDYKIRAFTDKIGIRNMFPTNIQTRW